MSNVKMSNIKESKDDKEIKSITNKKSKNVNM